MLAISHFDHYAYRICMYNYVLSVAHIIFDMDALLNKRIGCCCSPGHMLTCNRAQFREQLKPNLQLTVKKVYCAVVVVITDD